MSDVETSLGWIFNNPDTGREYSKQHPVTSGECDDATHIVPATAANLLAELKLAWEIAEEERVSEARKGAKWIKAADTIEALRAENARLREALPPIEHDDLDPTREYIPLPGGWEIQTKGRGSTYRLCDTKTGERHAILSACAPFIHDFVTRMAKEIHAAHAAMGEAE